MGQVHGSKLPFTRPSRTPTASLYCQKWAIRYEVECRRRVGPQTYGQQVGSVGASAECHAPRGSGIWSYEMGGRILEAVASEHVHLGVPRWIWQAGAAEVADVHGLRSR